MENFEGLGLSPALEKSLEFMNYKTPTPIQAKAIPLALAGNDIMGSAQTGTGKTAAFAIPLIERLLKDPRGSALVLTPTRELGKQIMDIMHQLIGPKGKIRTAFIIGGEPYAKQMKQLQNRPRLIVGTPGRINDHLERQTLMLDDVDFLVLDETDRMLDMGFTVQLEKIFSHMPDERQTLMFSATLPKNILKMADKYMKNPARVSAGEVNVIAQNIKQDVIRIEQDKKYDELLGQLHERTGSVIVFIKTKHGADRMADKLRRDGFTSEALHGDLRQRKRDQVMVNFRKQNFRVLIATDIAARGLDVPHIEHVVNYDLPQVAEDFIHRMGRTARAGAQGSAISFISNQERRKWAAIERLLNPQAGPEAHGDFGEDERPNKKGKPRRSRFGGKKFSGGHDAQEKAPRQHKDRKPKEKTYRDAPQGEKQYGEKPQWEKPRKEKQYNEKPYKEKSAKADGEKPAKQYHDAKKGGEKAQGKAHGKPYDKSGGKPDGKSNAKYSAKPGGKSYGKPDENKGKSFDKPRSKNGKNDKGAKNAKYGKPKPQNKMRNEKPKNRANKPNYKAA